MRLSALRPAHDDVFALPNLRGVVRTITGMKQNNLHAKSSSVPGSISLLREFSVPLIAGIVIALAWANVDPSGFQAVIHAKIGNVSLEFIVNEMFMAIFFGIAAVEITDSLMPGGSLSPPRKAVAPLAATAGGVLGPALTFIVLNHIYGDPLLVRGWGITTATDIALAWLVARMIFPKGHPAISFLLLLAIADDAVGLAIIAVFYPDPKHALYPPALFLVLVALLAAWMLRRFKVKSYWPYLLIPGPISWFGLFWAHLHPALALVFVVPFMPHQCKNPHATTFDLPPHTRSTLTAFEHEWKVIVDFGLFFFGLVNAGVQFTAVGTITWLIICSLWCGKTAGILVCGLLAKWSGFSLPAGMNTRDLLLVGMIAGIGLTVALFVAGAAFDDPALNGAARMGALASVLIAPVAILMGRLLRKPPFTASPLQPLPPSESPAPPSAPAQ